MVKTSVMPQGQAVVSGIFVKFDNILRNGFVVLNPDGSINSTYNTNGGFTTNANSFAASSQALFNCPPTRHFWLLAPLPSLTGTAATGS